MMVETMAGRYGCKLWQDRLRWGRFAASDVDMLMCEDAKTEKLDSGGSVPTRMFKRVLISHANSYVIVQSRETARPYCERQLSFRRDNRKREGKAKEVYHLRYAG